MVLSGILSMHGNRKARHFLFDFKYKLLNNILKHIFFLAIKIFAIYFLAAFWAAESDLIWVKIVDFGKLKMVNQFQNFAFTVLDPHGKKVWAL